MKKILDKHLFYKSTTTGRIIEGKAIYVVTKGDQLTQEQMLIWAGIKPNHRSYNSVIGPLNFDRVVLLRDNGYHYIAPLHLFLESAQITKINVLSAEVTQPTPDMIRVNDVPTIGQVNKITETTDGFIADITVGQDTYDPGQQLSEAMSGYFQSCIPAQEETLISSNLTCNHDWKHYQGLVEVYDYCEKCQEKKT